MGQIWANKYATIYNLETQGQKPHTEKGMSIRNQIDIGQDRSCKKKLMERITATDKKGIDESGTMTELLEDR